MLFFPKTIDGILADVTRKIEHLRIVAAAHNAKIFVHNEIAARHAELSALATAEEARARKIAAKFEELIS